MEAQEDPAAGFAALMSAAADEAAPAPADAPYGYTTDPKTGEVRAKKRPGRPRKPPTIDELKDQAAADPPDGDDTGDRAPDSRRGRGRASDPGPKQEDGTAAAPYRPGQITRGMNRRYRQLGKLVRAMDPAVGGALISMAENSADDGEDDSVGAAWEELARSNPRIRRFCLRLVQGGAWGGLLMAHMPLLIAVGMKFVSADPGFFGKLIASMAEPDPDSMPGEGGLPGGMTAEDARQVMGMMAGMFPAGS